MVMIHILMTIIIYTELLTNNELLVPGKGSVEGWWPSFNHLKKEFQHWVKGRRDDL